MSIKNTLKMQFSLMLHRKGFQISFSLVMIYCVVSYLSTCFSYLNKDVIDFYSANFLYCGNHYATYRGIFEGEFPFLIVFPFAFSYLDDKYISIAPYLNGRMKNRNYYLSKVFVSFLGGIIIIFIPFLLNLILCNITFEENHNTIFGPYCLVTYNECITGLDVYINTKFKGMPFLSTYISNPFLYNVMYLLIFSVFTGILSAFATSFSFLIKKHKILVLVPVYVILLLFKNLDKYLFHINNKHSYVNMNLLDYVSINVDFGRDYRLFVLIMILFAICSILIALLKSKEENI